MNRFFAGFQILRPLNMILCLLAVLIAAFLTGGLLSELLPYAILTVICFAGASNILNDVLDVRIDRVNRPERVLPSGRLKILDALLLMGVLYGVGILACTYVQSLGRQIALITVLPLLVLYTPLFKRLPFIGNIVVGSILGLVFVFTEGAIHGNADKMWIPFFLATALSVIRELIKDGADMAGDYTANLKTFPQKFGLISTLWLLRLMTTALCFFAITPYTGGYYGIIYLITLILGVEIPLLYSMFIFLSEKSGPTDYIKASKILKGVTMAGMLVILSSRF
jgi:geranylgeranylglycerol-phosphate geranylgeranyltransferase